MQISIQFCRMINIHMQKFLCRSNRIMREIIQSYHLSIILNIYHTKRNLLFTNYYIINNPFIVKFNSADYHVPDTRCIYNTNKYRGEWGYKIYTCPDTRTQMRLFGNFRPLQIFISRVALGERGEKSATEHPVRVNYRDRLISISNRFAVIIFASDESAPRPWARVHRLFAIFIGERERAGRRWRTAGDCIISLWKSRYGGRNFLRASGTRRRANRRRIHDDVRAATRR